MKRVHWNNEIEWIVTNFSIDLFACIFAQNICSAVFHGWRCQWNCEICSKGMIDAADKNLRANSDTQKQKTSNNIWSYGHGLLVEMNSAASQENVLTAEIESHYTKQWEAVSLMPTWKMYILNRLSWRYYLHQHYTFSMPIIVRTYNLHFNVICIICWDLGLFLHPSHHPDIVVFTGVFLARFYFDKLLSTDDDW